MSLRDGGRPHMGPGPRTPSGPAVIRPHHSGRTYDRNRPGPSQLQCPCETGAVHIWDPVRRDDEDRRIGLNHTNASKHYSAKPTPRNGSRCELVCVQSAGGNRGATDRLEDLASEIGKTDLLKSR